ncbi:MAG: hypothetical protein Q8R76_00590 [Candidatus Omnitrophota bacterium]|nr:hypothetical protein [Candidatus Omnitrophota bacterium]
MMLPLILFGGPVVGYLIGQYVLVDKFGWGEFCLPVSVGLGFVAAGMQTVKLIQRIRNYESHNKP